MGQFTNKTEEETKVTVIDPDTHCAMDYIMMDSDLSENLPKVDIGDAAIPSANVTTFTNNHYNKCKVSKPVARFEKVSFDTFLKSFRDIYVAVMSDGHENNDYIVNKDDLLRQARLVYGNIRLPRRATSRSAGYDFFFPFGYTELGPMVTSTIPTGIKVRIDGPYVLQLYPRSSLGFKYRLQLDNTVGIIDADYYNNPSNEGHIFVKITNDSQQGDICKLDIGDAFCQGIFTQYFITYDDDITAIRNGGIGSTDLP